MIHYTLVCGSGHEFEGWFRTSAAFDEQVARAELSCPHCGSTEVAKGIMAPNVATGRSREALSERRQLYVHAQQMRQMMAAWRAHVEKTCDYVGERFPEEARRIHASEEAEARGIYGEASPEEAKALIEEGIPIAPLPPAPKLN